MLYGFLMELFPSAPNFLRNILETKSLQRSPSTHALSFSGKCQMFTSFSNFADAIENEFPVCKTYTNHVNKLITSAIIIIRQKASLVQALILYHVCIMKLKAVYISRPGCLRYVEGKLCKSPTTFNFIKGLYMFLIGTGNNENN